MEQVLDVASVVLDGRDRTVDKRLAPLLLHRQHAVGMALAWLKHATVVMDTRVRVSVFAFFLKRFFFFSHIFFLFCSFVLSLFFLIPFVSMYTRAGGDCSLKICPSGTDFLNGNHDNKTLVAAPCSGRGTCLQQNGIGVCDCDVLFSGIACERNVRNVFIKKDFSFYSSMVCFF